MVRQNQFTIHTAIRPDEKEAATAPAPSKKTETKLSLPVKGRKAHRSLSVSERLFKNTAVACALLLCVMALKNIETPAANKITAAVKSVVHMDMKLPVNMQDLSFVQKLMPESALVFLNLTSTSDRALPIAGEIVHAYTEAQPWTEFRSPDNAPVFALADGKVEACVKTSEGDYTILVKNGNTEYLYAFLDASTVQMGDEIKKGTQLGVTGSKDRARLYLEYRIDGIPANPKPILG